MWGTERDRVSEPVEQPSRRRFLSYASGFLSGVIAAALGLPLARFFIGDAFAARGARWLRLGPVHEIPLGRPELFRLSYRDNDGWRQLMRRETVYVVEENGNLTVFSSACTHLGCPVHWDDKQRLFLCPCHNGGFAEDGSVVKGPPPRGLDRYEHKIEDNILFVRIERA